MRCVTCSIHLPSNNYALIEGDYFCWTCFFEQYANLSTTQTICQNCGSIPLSSSRTTLNQKQEQYGSATSLISTQSTKISEAARHIGTTIAKTFRRFRSPSASRTADDPGHQKPPHPSKTHNTTCQVCFDEKSSKYFHAIFNHNCLQVQRTICDTCIYRHIQQSFQEMCTDDVRCPELECNSKYTYDTIQHILISNKDKNLFERYDRFINLHLLEQMDEFIWCSNSKCQMGQLNDGGEFNNIVTCIRCYKKTCFKHKTKWHTGLTCEEYDLQINDDLRASLKWLNQNTKTCPNCPYQIEKNDGCDHMTCIKCQYEFCWSCLADYNQIRREGNHRHHPNCKHYAAHNGH
ncbi:unnamed protein product [Rotaria sordida]|uniref:RBR-type E3 ubiquitin transferase n=1 Tax=Rotaria sordida TaxID=392033 RepID=A0A815GN35_9BILA|nr:unnamed protein product [Rotaria sordida]CAF3897787.1 unnamed protein product [Rotaria sordida]